MTRKKRILQIVTQMNKGGLESRLMDLYREINRDEYQFDFLCLNEQEGYFDEEINRLGGQVFHLPSISLGNIKEISNQLDMFFRNNPDYKIVHCHLNQWCGFILKSAKLAKIPVRIAHSRTSLETLNPKNVLKNIIKLPVNYYSTHKMAVSKKAGIWLFGNKSVQNNEVYILPNAIKMSDFEFNKKKRKEYRKKLQIENKIVVIHVGNIRPEKNHDFLIDIFSSIKTKEKNAVLILVGEDYSEGLIDKKINENNLNDDIVKLGSRNDVNFLLQAGDIFIFPSFYEGFPGSVLEAQTSGLPCVISDTITEEILISDRILQLSLKESPNRWAEKSLEMYNLYSNNYRETPYLESKYDIGSSARELMEYYENTLIE